MKVANDSRKGSVSSVTVLVMLKNKIGDAKKAEDFSELFKSQIMEFFNQRKYLAKECSDKLSAFLTVKMNEKLDKIKNKPEGESI